MSRLKVLTGKASPDKKLARAVSVFLRQNKEKAVLLLVSGGSVLKTLDFIDQSALGENLTISLLDERFSRDIEIRNFFQLTKTSFYHQAQRRGSKFIPPLTAEMGTLVVAAKKWEQKLRRWLSARPDRIIITIMGMGTDGHTAGIMPFPENPQKFTNFFENKNKWIIGYNAGDKNQYPRRLTVSITFLQNIIDRAFVYVTGENKKNILEIVLKSDRVFEYPASITKKMKRVELFTDLELDT